MPPLSNAATASHEEKVGGVDRCAVAERDGFVVGVEAGVNLPLVVAERGEGRTLRRGAEAGEDQGGCRFARRPFRRNRRRRRRRPGRTRTQGVVAARSRKRVGTQGEQRVGAGGAGAAQPGAYQIESLDIGRQAAAGPQFVANGARRILRVLASRSWRNGAHLRRSAGREATMDSSSRRGFLGAAAGAAALSVVGHRPGRAGVSRARHPGDRALCRRRRQRHLGATAGPRPRADPRQAGDGREPRRRRRLDRLGLARRVEARRLHHRLHQRAQHIRRLSRQVVRAARARRTWRASRR